MSREWWIVIDDPYPGCAPIVNRDLGDEQAEEERFPNWYAAISNRLASGLRETRDRMFIPPGLEDWARRPVEAEPVDLGIV